MPRQVSLLLCWNIIVCRTCLGHNCSVEEKLKFNRGENNLEEVEKFCYLGDVISCYGGAPNLEEVEKFGYLGDVISCYGGAPEAVSAKIRQCIEKVQRVKQCFSWEAGFIFEATGEDLSVLY